MVSDEFDVRLNSQSADLIADTALYIPLFSLNPQPEPSVGIIKMTDFAIIFATLVGPILAVWAAEWRQQRKAQLDRKEWVFRTLMSTRGAKLRPDHVSAINHIEFAFPRKSCPDIDDARALYRKHLRNPDSVAEDAAIRQAWSVKSNELFSELLRLMAIDLKIPFTKTEITEDSYHPDAYLFQEWELRQIRQLVLQVLRDGRPINIRPVADNPIAQVKR